MKHPSIAEFRKTIRIFEDKNIFADGRIYSYWNNQDASRLAFPEELLHIKEHSNGSFILEIGNTSQEGTLAELEAILYKWAADEGWLGNQHSRPRPGLK